MKKIHHLILLVIGLATLLGSGGWLWYSRFAEKPLSCIGNVEWNIGSNRFAGTLAFRMYDNAGLATITGKLYGRNTSDISRNIYFNYTRQHMDLCQLQCTLVVLPQEVTSYPETKIAPPQWNSYLPSSTYATWVTESSNNPLLFFIPNQETS